MRFSPMPMARRGLDAECDDDIVHEAVRKGDAGLVELWPVTLKDEKAEPRSLACAGRSHRPQPSGAASWRSQIAETIAGGSTKGA